MSLADAILAQYPTPLSGPVTALGNHGGFSGARIFRVESAGGDLCLRAWPPDMTAARLDWIHALMRRATGAGLQFVPRLLATTRGASFLRCADGYWELTSWMPGTVPVPTRLNVETAAVALARIHRAWCEAAVRDAPCPAVERRLTMARDWQVPIASGWWPSRDPLDPALAPAEEAWAIVRHRLPELPALLEPWRHRPMPLQPCLCDVWHAHVLFTGERVTGLVDYGSCKVDHVAVDLARLLGSLAGDDTAMWTAGLDAYARERRLTDEERALAHDLDRSGVVVAAANWLRWLYREGRVCPDRTAVAGRLQAIVERLERR
jgi:Ser/Thr protein kinase RdoA (MazF antagonist)